MQDRCLETLYNTVQSETTPQATALNMTFEKRCLKQHVSDSVNKN